MLAKPKNRKKRKPSFHQRLLNKINALPKEQKETALLKLELHEYCKARDKQHTTLIRDIPHPLMITERDYYSGRGWCMSGE
jgi:hypothetical protein